MNTQIKLVQPEEHSFLSELCKRIYVEHYLHLWSEGGKEWYLEKSYAPKVILAEIENDNSDYFILYVDMEPAGYLKVNYCYSEKETALEIERIYLYEKFKGTGNGKKLILFAIELAQKLGKQSAILKAMDSSLDAIGFYKKIGFKQIGTLILENFELMKPEYRGMVILEYAL